MKKWTIKDELLRLIRFVNNKCEYYDHNLKWHDKDIEEIKSNIMTINRLIMLLFIENIAIILLLIIWSW